MKTEIFIEDNRLDLYDDIQAELTYSIDDIKEFSSRNTSYSKTIVIPGTSNNNKIFGHVFEFTSANPYNPATVNVGNNFNAAVSANCKVYVDNIQIFKGVIRLLEIVIDNGIPEYECAVFGELGGFISNLSDELIEDLDFSNYDHVWTIANIQNSWDSNASGYYYPLIDYGTASTGKNNWDVKTFRPALYAREYVTKIIANSGYTFESNFFDTALFKRLIIPNNGKDILKLSNTPLSASISTTVTMLTSTGVNIKDVPWQTVTVNNMTANVGNTIFTYNGVTTTFTLSITLNGNLQSYKDVRIRIYKNATVYYENTQALSNAITRPYLVSYTASILLTTNDTLRVEYYTDTTGNNPFLVTITSGTLTLTQDSAVSYPASYGDTISMNANIPKGIYQRDFFASILKMFNLYVTESTSKSKHLIIEPYINFYTITTDSLLIVNGLDELLNIDNTDQLIPVPGGYIESIDWSYKLDRSKPIKLKPMSEINGRYFEFKYKSDSDYYNDQYAKKYGQGYGDRIEDTGFQFVNTKQTAEIIFAATPLVGYASIDKVYPTIFSFSNSQEEKINSVIRILQRKKITGVNSYNILNGATVLVSTTTYGYAGHVDDPTNPAADINFGAPKQLYYNAANYTSANLFNGYWSDYIAEISDKDSKLLTAYFRLTEIDIYNLDFKKYIYIDGALFRINKIKDFNTIDLTEVELLRVINTNYA